MSNEFELKCNGIANNRNSRQNLEKQLKAMNAMNSRSVHKSQNH